jgi:TRAP-type transport system periplasmic protein
LFERQQSRELNVKLRGELAKQGMQINDVPEAERERMREKLKPVIAKYSASLGEPLVKEFYGEIDKQRQAHK